MCIRDRAGFNQTVASLGTALTPGHARLLKRYTDNVLITYDSDEAGVKAALRAIPILKEAGLSTKVINMRPYKDPDEFIKAMGAEAFQERIDNAENSFMYEIGTCLLYTSGSTITKDELQKWVDYANKVGAVIIYEMCIRDRLCAVCQESNRWYL